MDSYKQLCAIKNKCGHLSREIDIFLDDDFQKLDDPNFKVSIAQYAKSIYELTQQLISDTSQH